MTHGARIQTIIVSRVDSFVYKHSAPKIDQGHYHAHINYPTVLKHTLEIISLLNLKPEGNLDKYFCPS